MQNKDRHEASARVAAWLAARGRDKTWLALEAGLDAGTVGDFLNGSRWPQLRTQGAIERALGWQSGSIHQIGRGADPETVGAPIQDPPAYVAAPGATKEGGLLENEVLRQLIAMRGQFDQMQAELRTLSERVERLEQPGS